jgi:hypothetical protein
MTAPPRCHRRRARARRARRSPPLCPPPPPDRRRRRHARLAAPRSGAIAASLLSEEDVARSLPQGTRFLAGTAPTCEEVKAGVEYHCTIKGASESEIDGSLAGTVEPTVDATKHVNGGCRSLRADGREWTCYVGQAAVEQKIIGPDFLGEYAPAPGVG